MKKGCIILFVLFSIASIKAQKKQIEKAKDTVKTEVVEVITKFNPKIADAKKIRKNPIIKFSKNSKKKELEYAIFSAPVASTFIPKSGVVKGIDVGVRERRYNNYLALGYGNFGTPFVETFLHHITRFKNEFGFSAKYLASEENIENTLLDSNYSNLNAGFFYKQEARYFDWKVSLNSEINQYNWYGLPDIISLQNTINAIDEAQMYKYFEILGELNFTDSYLSYVNLSGSHFSDDFDSKEILIKLDAKLDFPLDFINYNLNNLSLNTSLEFLNGEFKSSYNNTNSLKYNIKTFKINPEYKMSFIGVDFKLGFKTYLSLDSENEATNLLIYPDLLLKRQIIKKHLNVYAGFSGDLHTNTHKRFTEENPFISPTQFITQTSEKSNLFLGFNGSFSNDFSFNIKASIKEEEDKPLFYRNNSKSNGIATASGGVSFKGYEYGNSFSVFYDDVKTTSVSAEIEYDVTKRMILTTQFQFDNYTVTNAFTDFNLPTLQGSLAIKYKRNKWYATSNVFYVNERKDAIYAGTFPSNFSSIETINSIIDLNLNGGYHFNDKFSTFLKINNILNTEYQRFANFDTQGFQVLAGVTYKFDF